LTWEKDPIAHLDLTSSIRREVPDLVHVFAGDGPLRSDLESAVLERGLQDRVLLLGNRPDVGDLLAASDVMLLMSLSEGMPGCLIEAGMAGLPVASYDVSGVPEVVVDGETGVLAPSGDSQVLRQGLTELLLDDPRRRAMGRAARERCLARYDIRVVAPRYLDLYSEVARS
jgi:glycosyltransferase involved in cell wall biosynthesis